MKTRETLEMEKALKDLKEHRERVLQYKRLYFLKMKIVPRTPPNTPVGSPKFNKKQ